MNKDPCHPNRDLETILNQFGPAQHLLFSSPLISYTANNVLKFVVIVYQFAPEIRKDE